MLDWRRVNTLAGETAREMGVLIMVFAPLESVFTDIAVSGFFVAAMLVFGLALIAGGIIVEARK